MVVESFEEELDVFVLFTGSHDMVEGDVLDVEVFLYLIERKGYLFAESFDF